MKNDEIILYNTTDGIVKLNVLFSDETVWLTQEQMAALFQKAKSTVNEHILNAYAENELDESTTKRKIGNSDFSTKPTNYYNLDVIISVGYRVKSHQGTQFRQWATARLRDYIIKGFALNDERFKTGSSMNYFRELLDRIREITIPQISILSHIQTLRQANTHPTRSKPGKEGVFSSQRHYAPQHPRSISKSILLPANPATGIRLP